MASQRVTSTATYGAVSGDVTTSAKVLVPAASGRTSVVIQNVHGSNDLYVGTNSSVTSSNGIKVAAGSSVTFDDYMGDIYGIASAASTGVRYFQVGA